MPENSAKIDDLLGSEFQSLAAALYRAATDTSYYGELFMLWLSWVDRLIGQPDELSPEFRAEATKHLVNAVQIFKTQSDLRLSRSLEVLATIPAPACVLNGDLGIIEANGPWRDEMAYSSGDVTAQLDFEEASADVLAGLARGDPTLPYCERVLLRATDPRTGEAEMYTLDRLPTAATIGSNAQRLLLARVAPSYSQMLGELLHQRFGLTEAECDVVRGLIAGETAPLIAARRGVKPSTIQTQIKAIFVKTGTSGKAGLMALISQIRGVALEPPRSLEDKLSPAAPWNTLVTLPDPEGGFFSFAITGDELGTPVLFAHQVTAALNTPAVAQAASALGIKLISLRPKGSSPDGPIIQPPDHRRIGRAARALGLESYGLMSATSGIVPALRHAGEATGKITQAVMIDSGGPAVTAADFRTLPVVQRLGRFTARVLPEAMILPMTVIHQDVLRRQYPEMADSLLMHLALTADDDEIVAQDPAIKAAIDADIAQTYADVPSLVGVHRQWSEDFSPELSAAAANVPIQSFAGGSNPNIDVDLTNRRLGACGAGPVELVEGTGFLSIYVSPRQVFAPFQKKQASR